MDNGMLVFPCDLHRGVGRARGGSPDQQRKIEIRTLHLAGDMDHLVEGGGNKAAQTDDVDLVLLGRGQDFIARHHDAKIDHFVAVAGKDDADDVLADVVDIPLDRGHKNLFCGTGIRCGRFLSLHEGGQEGDRLLHDSGTLHHLRQEHFAHPEEIADNPHAVHERALNDQQGTPQLHAGLLGILVDVVNDPLDQGVLKTFLDGAGTPSLLCLLFLGISTNGF